MYIASCSMKFHPGPVSGTKGAILCDYVMKKPSGKVNSERVHLHFKEGKLMEIGPTAAFQYKQKEEAKEVDPAANLSFNLHLSTKEKEARSQVSLPYVLSARNKDHVLQGARSKDLKMGHTEGEIEYEPDDADDFDEDDPDDDLDI